jgi:hypothetical protein
VPLAELIDGHRLLRQHADVLVAGVPEQAVMHAETFEALCIVVLAHGTGFLVGVPFNMLSRFQKCKK